MGYAVEISSSSMDRGQTGLIPGLSGAWGVPGWHWAPLEGPLLGQVCLGEFVHAGLLVYPGHLM